MRVLERGRRSNELSRLLSSYHVDDDCLFYANLCRNAAERGHDRLCTKGKRAKRQPPTGARHVIATRISRDLLGIDGASCHGTPRVYYGRVVVGCLLGNAEAFR